MAGMRGDIAWMLAGRMVAAASLWLVVIAIAQLGSREMLGQYSYALALVAPLVMFSRLNLRVFMVTDVAGQFRPGDYLTTRIAANVAVLILVLALVWLRGLGATAAAVVIAVALYKLAESTSDFYHGVMQSQQRMRPFAVSLVLHGLVCLASFVAGLILWQSVLAGALMTAAGWLALLYVYDRPRARAIMPSPIELRAGAIVPVVKACLLLGVIMGLIALRINLPVYFVEARFGFDDLGLYSAAAYFLLVGNLIVTSVLEVAMPRLARARVAQGSGDFGRLLGKVLLLLVAVGATGVAAAVCCGEWLMGVIYGAPYAQTGPLLIWFAAAVTVGFVAQALGALLTVARRFHYQVAANVVSIAVIAAVCGPALAGHGLTGAGMAVLAGSLALLLVNALSVLRCRDAIFRAAPVAAAEGASP